MRYILVVFTTAILLSVPSYAAEPDNKREMLCSNALNACLELSKQQDASIVLLRMEVSKLDNSLVDAQSESKDNKIVYFLLGALVSGAVVYTLHR